MINAVLVILGIILTALAQVMLKKSGDFDFFKEINFFIYFFLGGFFYALSFGIYAYLLKIFSISKISPVMTIATMLLVVLSGVLIFKEILSTKQLLGICFGVISIILIIE